MEVKLGEKFSINLTPLKIAALVLSLGAAAVSLVIYWKYSQLKTLANVKISEQIQKATGRKITVGKTGFSPLEGILLENACVKEKDGKTDFFCFEKGNIKVETLPAVKGKLIFSDVSFENGKLNLKKTADGRNSPSGATGAGGYADGWNFSDLIALLPKNNKPIHLNWNAKNFAFNNFSINLSPDPESRNEIIFNGARLSVEHRSNTGGNFVLKIKSGINANLNGKFVSGELSSFWDLNFEYARLRSAKGDIEMGKIVFDDITAGGLNVRLEAFGLDGKNSGKKFELEAALRDLLIPSSNPLAGEIGKKTAVLEKILGKTLRKENEFSMKKLEIKSAYDGRKFSNSLSLISNLMDLSLKSDMDIANSKHAVFIEINNTAKKIKIKSESAVYKPKPEPAMSETMDEMLKQGIVGLEKYLMAKIGD